MRFRNWLLTGTSITLLALAPATAARAQDATNPDLVAAYQAFAADQSDQNKTKLNEACIAAGFQSLDDCITALSGAAPLSAPAKPEQAAPSSEAAPPPPPPADNTPPPSSKEAAPAPADTTPPPADNASSSAAPPPAPASSAEPVQPAAPDISGPLTAAVKLYNKGAA